MSSTGSGFTSHLQATCKKGRLEAAKESGCEIVSVPGRGRVSHSTAPYPHTDEVGGQRKPIWLGGVVQDKHSINDGRSSVVACGPDDPLVLVELNLGQIDL